MLSPLSALNTFFPQGRHTGTAGRDGLVAHLLGRHCFPPCPEPGLLPSVRRGALAAAWPPPAPSLPGAPKARTCGQLLRRAGNSGSLLGLRRHAGPGHQGKPACLTAPWRWLSLSPSQGLWYPSTEAAACEIITALPNCAVPELACIP